MTINFDLLFSSSCSGERVEKGAWSLCIRRVELSGFVSLIVTSSTVKSSSSSTFTSMPKSIRIPSAILTLLTVWIRTRNIDTSRFGIFRLIRNISSLPRNQKGFSIQKFNFFDICLMGEIFLNLLDSPPNSSTFYTAFYKYLYPLHLSLGEWLIFATLHMSGTFQTRR